MQQFNIELLKQAKERYADEGFNIVGFFGSYARGEATKESDIDILYELNEKFIKAYSGFLAFSRLSEIKEELKTLFGIEVDISAKSGLNKGGQVIMITHLLLLITPQQSYVESNLFYKL